MANEMYPTIAIPEEQTSENIAIPEITPIKIPKYREQIAAQLALTAGSDYGEAYKRYMAEIEIGGIEAVRDSMSQIRSERNKEVLFNDLQNIRGRSKEDIESLLMAYQTETAPKKSDYFALEKETVLAASASNYIISTTERNMAVDSLIGYNMQQEITREASEENGLWQTIQHLGKSFIPGYLAAKYNQATAKTIKEFGGKVPSLGFFGGFVPIEWDVDTSRQVNSMFRSMMASANGQQREKLLTSLYTNLKKDTSIVGDPNYATVLQGIERALETSDRGLQEEVFFSALDAATLLSPAGFSKLGRSLVSGISKVKMPAQILKEELKDTASAVHIITKDIKDGTETSGMTKSEITGSSLSFGQVPYLAGHAVMEGLAPEIKQTLAIQTQLEAFQNILKYTGRTGLSPDDIKDAILDLKQKVYVGQDLYKVDFGNADDIGQQVLAFWQHPSGRRFRSKAEADRFALKKEFEEYEVVEIPDEKKFVIKTDSLHKWNYGTKVRSIEEEAYQIGKIRHIPGVDPKQVVYSHTEDIRAVIEHESATVKRSWEKLLQNVYKGLDREDARKLGDILKLGDSFSDADGLAGRTFNISELSGMGANPRTIDAYYKFRNVRDLAWFKHNKSLADVLNFSGHLEFKFDGSEAVQAFSNGGKPLDLGIAKSFYTQNKYRTLPDINTGELVKLSDETIDAFYKKGYKIVSFQKPVVVSGKKYKHALVRDDTYKVSEWTSPLGYVEGTVGRIYTDPYYVILKFDGEIDGVVQKGLTKTLATSPNMTEAKAYVSKYNKALEKIREFKKEHLGYKIDELGEVVDKAGKRASPEILAKGDKLLKDLSELIDDPELFLRDVSKGEIPENAKFDFHFDRQGITFNDYKIDELINTGKLFSSERGERLMSISGGYAPTKSPVAAMGQEMLYLSRYLSLEQWKQTEIRRWLESAGDNLKRTGNDVEDFLSGEITIPKGDPRRDILDAQRKYIKGQAGVMTRDERATVSYAQRMAEWLEGVGLKDSKAHKFALGLRHQGVSDVLKSANYHLSLGMLNIAQIPVQAAGMFVAVSAHPLHGLPAALSAPIYRIALMTRNEVALEALARANKVVNLGFGSTEEFLETVDAIRKSGILDSLRSTSLYDVKEHGLDFGVKSLSLYDNNWQRANAIKKGALKVGEWPFQRGEEMMRLVSWDVSRREWKKLNPDKAVNTRNALLEIGEKADDYMLGMTRANRAAYQEGILGVPFQFLQYNLKLATSLMGRQSFTPAEKFRIIAGQGLLYGTAGIPFGTWMVDSILGEDATKFTPTEKLTISQGIIAGMIMQVTGAEVAIGSRLGAGDFFERFYRGFFEDDFSMREFALGPSGHLMTNTWDFSREIARMAQVSQETEIKDTTLFVDSLSQVLNLAASWKNSSKAMFALQTDGVLRSRTGTPLAKLTDTEWVGKGLGFQTQKEVLGWRQKDYIKEYDYAISDWASTLVTLRLRKLNALNNKDTIEVEKTQNNIDAFMLAIPSYSQRMAISRLANQRLSKEPEFDKHMKKAAERSVLDLDGDIVKSKRVFGAKPLTPFGGPEK